MDDRQTRKYNAAASGIAVMDENLPIWTASAAITGKVTAIKTSINKIEDWESKQEADITGNAAAKKKAKKDAAELAWTICKPLATYATDTNDDVLRNEIDFEKTDLLFAKDATAKDRWQLVHDRADTNIAALTAGGYPVTALGITDLDNAIKAFADLEGTPRSAKSASKAAGTELKKEFVKLDELIDLLLDLIVPFAVTNSDFYNAVVDGFEIVDTGIRHLALRTIFVDDTTGVRLPSVNATVPELALSKKSTKRGVVTFTLQEMENGNYTLVAEKKNYTLNTTNNIAVDGKKLKRLEVRMVKVV